MKPAHSSRETEIKLPVSNIAAILRRLKQSKARNVVPRTYEFNTLFDNPGRLLSSQGRLLRVRVNQFAPHSTPKRRNGAGSAVLTYKGPALPAKRASPRKASKARFKIKEEVEVEFCNVTGDSREAASQMERILRALGLGPVFQYEKFRTTYVLPGIPGVKVELDETPVGSFLELEGTESAIDRAATLLGYSSADYSTKTYGALYIEFCRSRGVRPGNMLFAATTKLR